MSTQDWTTAVAAKESDFLAYVGRGISLWMAGELEAAGKDLDKATKLNRRSEEARRVRDLIERERQFLLQPPELLRAVDQPTDL